MTRKTLTARHSFPLLLGMGIFLLGWLYFTLIHHTRVQATEYSTLSSRSISLANRYNDPMVNEVMKKNILLTLAYKRGIVSSGQSVDWSKVETPFEYNFEIKPGEMFVFNEDILPEYKNRNFQTVNSHFNYDEGFVSDGYLVGDGVCHLASLFYWAAKDAGLDAIAPTAHDFARIPEIAPEYGVSIYFEPGNYESNALQNLYVTNPLNKPVEFWIKFEKDNLKVTVVRKVSA